MKNNLHTELREEWNELYGDDFKDGRRDKYFDFWLQKIDELTKQVSIQDDIQVENPECKHCGLKKSTVDATGHLCPNWPQHDFGIVNSLSTSPDSVVNSVVKPDTLEELIDEYGELNKPNMILVSFLEGKKWTSMSALTPKEAVSKLLKALTKKG